MSQRVLFLLVLELAAALWSQAGRPDGWTVDLKNYGFREWHEGNGLRRSSDLAMATTNDAVAIALGNPSATGETGDQSHPASTKSQISLLVFDARTGKLLSKSGPWTADHFFELFSTSQGKWLLLLRHYKGTSEEPGETLLLLSSTGEEMRRLSLSPSILSPKPGSNMRTRPTWNIFLVSSSGGSVLIGRSLPDGVHYKLLQADTLDTQLEWTAEVGSNPLSVIALSDKELLGLGKPEPQQEKNAGSDGGQLYVRSLNGPWTPFPVSLDLTSKVIWLDKYPGKFAFLSDQTIAGVRAKQETSKSPVVVLGTDGTTILTPVIPKLSENTLLSGPVKVAQNGHYFGIGFEHRPWLSHLMLDVWQMDMAFQPDELTLLVWESSRPMPVAQLGLGSVYDVRGLSFVLDDPPSIALLGRSALKVIPAHER